MGERSGEVAGHPSTTLGATERMSRRVCAPWMDAGRGDRLAARAVELERPARDALGVEDRLGLAEHAKPAGVRVRARSAEDVAELGRGHARGRGKIAATRVGSGAPDAHRSCLHAI